MDPATIATAAVTILTPFVKDAGGELVRTVGEIALNKAKNLLAWLKQQFANDPAASRDVTRFEADPDKFGSSLEATIKEKAQENPNFATDLEKSIDDIGPTIAVFQRIKDGKSVTGVEADAINSGKVSVAQEADKVEGMTGVRAKTIG